jgi:parallel beta-helix repeat protein
MKKFTALIALMPLLLLNPPPGLTETYVSGEQSGYWGIEGSPYLVTGEIIISSDSVLVIEAGVEVNFQDHYKFIVNGSLEAIGNESDSITFTATNSTVGWHGIRFIDATGDNYIEFCIIQYGIATGSDPDNFGGGIYCINSSLTVGHCRISQNQTITGKGGGIFSENCGYTTIYENTITLNIAEHGAGVTFHYSGGLIEGNSICHNDAINWSGAGIALRGCSPTVQNNIVNDNNSIEDSGTGIYADFSSHPLIAYNEVCNNNNIGIFAGVDCNPVLDNNTISENGSYGVEAYDNSHISGTNNIIWNNGDIFSIVSNSSISLEYSDIEDGWPGTGNIDEDPIFVDPGNDDFHLMANSPCIDAGDPSSPLDPDNTIADMGAYYFNQDSVAILSWDPGSHDFGEIPVGYSSSNFTFTLTNEGEENSSGSVSTTGDFHISGGASYSLDPSQTATFDVYFQPTILGSLNGTLTASSANQPSADLSGTGVESPPGWQFDITCTGEEGTAPNQFIITIGGSDQQLFTPAPPPPPEYMCWTQLWDTTTVPWGGPYAEMIYEWFGTTEYVWTIELDPNGNVMPPESRTSTFTWDPLELPNVAPDYHFWIEDDSGNVVVADMSQLDSLQVTGTSTVFYHIKYGYELIWELLITCTGEQGTAPNEFFLNIGGGDQTINIPAPPTPPEYMCWTQMWDASVLPWGGPYAEMICPWINTNEYTWTIELDPNGNVMPPISRTSILTWNPSDLPFTPADYKFSLLDEIGGVVIADMALEDTLTVTGDSTVFYHLKYGRTNVPYVFDLSQYWNLISLPVMPANPNLNDLFPNATVAYGFESNTYVEASQLDNGKAYWVYVPDAEIDSVWGMPFGFFNTAVTPPWEMMGSVYESAIPTVSPGSMVVMYGFDQTYYQVPSFTMDPGLGYWVNFTDDVINFSLGEPSDGISLGKSIIAKGNQSSTALLCEIDEDWELPVVVTGEEGGAPNQFTVYIGGAETQTFTPAPPPPPQYMTYAQLYDSAWAGPYFRMIDTWPSPNLMWWRLEIDPNGNIMPPESRTTVVTWDPNNLPTEFDFFILDAVSGDTVIADMRADSTFSTTGNQNVYFNIFALSPASSDLTITLTPFNPPIQIPASGGSFDYNIAIANNGATPVVGDVWCDVTLPNGNPYGPTLGPVNLTFPVGFSGNRDRTQDVPSIAPLGVYSYNGYVGIYPDTVWNQSSFEFEKLEVGDGEFISEWFNYGESFEEWLTDPLAGVEEIPSEFALNGTFPNPFNMTSVVKYSLPEACNVSLTIYDISGRMVSELVDGWRDAGYHEATFDGSHLASGMYIFTLKAGNFVESGKMVLIK